MNEKEPCKVGQQTSLYSVKDVGKLRMIHFREADEIYIYIYNGQCTECEGSCSDASLVSGTILKILRQRKGKLGPH